MPATVQAEGDLAETQEAIDRLTNLPADQGSAMLEITLLRLPRTARQRTRRRDCLSGLSGSLPRDGDIAGLRGAYEVGRGDAVTAGDLES